MQAIRVYSAHIGPRSQHVNGWAPGSLKNVDNEAGNGGTSVLTGIPVQLPLISIQTANCYHADVTFLPKYLDMVWPFSVNSTHLYSLPDILYRYFYEGYFSVYFYQTD